MRRKMFQDDIELETYLAEREPQLTNQALEELLRCIGSAEFANEVTRDHIWKVETVSIVVGGKIFFERAFSQSFAVVEILMTAKDGNHERNLVLDWLQILEMVRGLPPSFSWV